MTPLGFCFCAPSLILTGQVLLVVTQAEPIAEWVHKPVRLTSEPWGPTKLRSWHPSDHRPKSPKAHTSQAGAGDFNYLGSSPPSQMFSPSRKLKDSFLSFQEKDTSAQPHPESDQFTVPHQRLTNKMTPPRKLPGNILKLNGDQNQPPQFKSISSVDQAADNQLYDILVPPLDSKSSGVTKFIVSLQDLKKDLAQHKKLSKVVVGTTNQLVKPQLQNKTVEDDYGDQSMTEANSDSLPVQSQENRKEPPEPSEQAEPPEYQLEAQTQDSENLGVEGLGSGNHPEAFIAPAELPEEAKPPIKLPAPLQAPESTVGNVDEIPPVHQVTVQPTQSEEHHYQLPNVTVRPVDVTLTITSEPTKEMESSLTQQESPVHPLENAEETEPFLTTQSSEHHEVTVSPLTHHSSLSTTTVNPPDVLLTITQEPTAEVVPPPVHHETIAKPFTSTVLTSVQDQEQVQTHTERELLVQMKPNSSMTTNICDFCLCENETLLCSHLSPKRRLHQVPVPRPEIHKHPLTFLNFQGNSISYIEKHVWKAYRWTETLILSENLLTELHKDTFEGLLSLQVLDVSCNKIRYIERRTFESLPFVKYMNLGCNLLIELSFGTFQAWHGMQFLQKLILSRNPLTVVEDPYFYKLPALKYLDLGTTQVPLKALENILMMTLELEHLILPKHMVCCLCKYKADIEIVCKTIKLHCHIGCLINTTYCLEASIGNPEGPFMKVLQSRKENTSTELAIEPESSYPLVMSPGDQFESHLNKQLRPLIPNNNVRRLISHVIRTLKMDCTDSHVQLSCAKLISRTGLLMKLLSEQQEFKLSRTDWDTEQWKTENYINESTEAQGEQKGLEPSQLTKAVPGYGYNNKVILAISVTVVVTVLIIIFCLIEVRTTGHSCSKDTKKLSII
uniref:Leucine-rich repeat-containing protein 37B-like n=1 Tax=Peromyscus maniculatus bairdii TaxID=230844 RepID=A0A8C8W319_PERMB